MKIAVLGWGSLIWCPGSLRLANRWFKSGPSIPIEFARISDDGRMTLVIHGGSPTQVSCWARCSIANLEGARRNLQEREGAKALSKIHSLSKSDTLPSEDPQTPLNAIKKWLDVQDDLDSAIWTGISSNWDERRHHPFSPDDAVAYVREREDQTVFKRIREYVENAPSWVSTPVRVALEREFRWRRTELSETLFEPDQADLATMTDDQRRRAH